MVQPARRQQVDDWDVAPDTPDRAGVRLEPCAPTEVYAHPADWANTENQTHVPAARSGRRTRARELVSLMWAGVIALAAVQHAREIERRASASEPSTAELAMQTRPARQIKAAWHDIGDRETGETVPQAQQSRPALLSNLALSPAEPIEPAEKSNAELQIASKSGLEDKPALKMVEPELIQEPKPATVADRSMPEAEQLPTRSVVDLPAETVEHHIEPGASPRTDRGANPRRMSSQTAETRPRRAARTARHKEPAPTMAFLLPVVDGFTPAQYFTIYGLNRHAH